LGTINLPGGATGTTIGGTANSGATFNFFNAGETLTSPSSGQARVTGNDTNFTTMSLAFANGNLFDRLVFNLDSSAAGSVTVQATDNIGVVFTQTLALSAGGQNFINVQSQGTEDIGLVQFTSTVQLNNIAQVRADNIPGTIIAPPPVTAVPEPTTSGLIGLGLFGMGFLRRKLCGNKS